MSTQPPPTGVVQFITSGNNEQQCKQIFKIVICLVDKGYQHIGLTYSANFKKQTTKILTTYNYDTEAKNFKGSIDDEKTIGDTGIGGTGQAAVLPTM